MKIGLVTDSTCDLSPEYLEKLEIEMVPLTINFNEEEMYKDIIDISQENFLEKLVQADNLPTTSQPAIGWFVEKYQEMSEKYDYIISIHLSGKLSGTCKSAMMAAQQVENVQVEVIDSNSASFGIAYQVLYAKQMIEKGMEIGEIVDNVKKLQENIRIYFTVNDLNYLQKGGRIGKAQAFLGSVLNFYPILHIKGGEGEILPYEKLRGKNKIAKRMIELALEEADGEEQLSLGFVHASEMKHYNKFKNDLLEQLSNRGFDYVEKESFISSVIACHVGPSVYGIVLVKGEKLDL